jgi:hypothetical protein
MNLTRLRSSLWFFALALLAAGVPAAAPVCAWALETVPSATSPASGEGTTPATAGQLPTYPGTQVVKPGAYPIENGALRVFSDCQNLDDAANDVYWKFDAIKGQTVTVPATNANGVNLVSYKRRNGALVQMIAPGKSYSLPEDLDVTVFSASPVRGQGKCSVELDVAPAIVAKAP